MRNVEGDLRVLVRIFNTCYVRNDNEIPEYDGVEIKSSIYNCGSIKSNINGEEYERHIRDGRTLADALLSSAYNLGAEMVIQGDDMKIKNALVESQSLLIETLLNKIKTLESKLENKQ